MQEYNIAIFKGADLGTMSDINDDIIRYISEIIDNTEDSSHRAVATLMFFNYLAHRPHLLKKHPRLRKSLRTECDGIDNDIDEALSVGEISITIYDELLFTVKELLAALDNVSQSTTPTHTYLRGIPEEHE